MNIRVQSFTSGDNVNEEEEDYRKEGIDSHTGLAMRCHWTNHFFGASCVPPGSSLPAQSPWGRQCSHSLCSGQILLLCTSDNETILVMCVTYFMGKKMSSRGGTSYQYLKFFLIKKHYSQLCRNSEQRPPLAAIAHQLSCYIPLFHSLLILNKDVLWYKLPPRVPHFSPFWAGFVFLLVNYFPLKCLYCMFSKQY